MQYFTKENEITKFNLEDALKKQNKIWTKYENQTDVLLYCSGEKVFIDKYDKYLLMTLEEINEAMEEFNNTKDRFGDEYLLEVIDILMYSMTMLDIVQLNIRTYASVMKLDTSKLLTNSLIIDPEDMFYNMTERFNEIFNTLISTRRLYSARKWHKPHLELDNEKNLENLKETYDLLTLAIVYICELLTSGTDYEYLNKLINEKQDFVINLPMYHK